MDSPITEKKCPGHAPHLLLTSPARPFSWVPALVCVHPVATAELHAGFKDTRRPEGKAASSLLPSGTTPPPRPSSTSRSPEAPTQLSQTPCPLPFIPSCPPLLQKVPSHTSSTYPRAFPNCPAPHYGLRDSMLQPQWLVVISIRGKLHESKALPCWVHCYNPELRRIPGIYEADPQSTLVELKSAQLHILKR